ncbi:hypothetical protein H4582DRAFT_2153637 [Lactarius indigo]|nr:hypothetical protein H4582DRAFT_2153637 [Lactarius indigo]
MRDGSANYCKTQEHNKWHSFSAHFEDNHFCPICGTSDGRSSESGFSYPRGATYPTLPSPSPSSSVPHFVLFGSFFTPPHGILHERPWRAAWLPWWECPLPPPYLFPGVFNLQAFTISSRLFSFFPHGTLHERPWCAAWLPQWEYSYFPPLPGGTYDRSDPRRRLILGGLYTFPSWRSLDRYPRPFPPPSPSDDLRPPPSYCSHRVVGRCRSEKRKAGQDGSGEPVVCRVLAVEQRSIYSLSLSSSSSPGLRAGGPWNTVPCLFLRHRPLTTLGRPPPTVIAESQGGEPHSDAFGTGVRVAGSISLRLVLLLSVGAESGKMKRKAGQDWSRQSVVSKYFSNDPIFHESIRRERGRTGLVSTFDSKIKCTQWHFSTSICNAFHAFSSEVHDHQMLAVLRITDSRMRCKRLPWSSPVRSMTSDVRPGGSDFRPRRGGNFGLGQRGREPPVTTVCKVQFHEAIGAYLFPYACTPLCSYHVYGSTIFPLGTGHVVTVVWREDNKLLPSDPSSPTPESKCARQEIPSPSSHKLDHLHEDLQKSTICDKELDFDLNRVYSGVRSALALLDDETHLGRLVAKDVFKENVQKQREQFFQLLRKVLEGSVGVWTLIDHSVFWTSPPLPQTEFKLGSEAQAWNATEASQHEAIENSWTVDFIDQSPLDGLRAHIVEQFQPEPSSETQIYGRYCSIVQSSGMGKSRLLDEFSKNYFLIPINLRASTDQGYPPADSEVRAFLTRHDGYMSKDQTMHSPGGDRSDFYDGVIAQARLTLKRSSNGLNSAEIAQALNELREVLNSGPKESSTHCIYLRNDFKNHKSCTGPKSDCVDVFITFDEAHTLADSFDDTRTHESRFVVLHRILHSLSSDPLFSFFLSTTSKITQFGQPRGQDASNRINDGSLATPRPYILLGFDQLMQSRKILDRWTTLDDVVSLECIAHMGWPLWGTRYDHGNEDVRQSLIHFATQKLLCGNSASGTLTHAQIYAVLSQRLVLDINTPQYLFDLSSPLDAMQTMHEQIANHMRVCMAVGSGIESFRSITSSEPILSEAASLIMSSTTFNLPRALSLVLKGFSINQGDRGELEKVCHHFSVNALFKGLLTESAYPSISGNFPSLCHTKSQRPFEEVFEKANMHFNHVIKPQAQRLLARRFLLFFMARGAAALGANCQPGFDAVYPYLYDSLNLNVKNVGFIIVQVKNDSNASRSDEASIFKKMDPFKCGLLGDSDKVDGRFPIPIIRILFSLIPSEKPGFTQMTYGVPTEGTENLEDRRPLFTSYDFMCSGVSEDFLQPVKTSPEIWKAFLHVGTVKRILALGWP